MQNKRVNVLVVATATATVHAAMSVAFVPFFSTLLVSLAGPAASATGIDTGMTLAVFMPLIYGGVGFALGALMAAGYNAFAWALLSSPIGKEVTVKEEEQVGAAVVGDAA